MASPPPPPLRVSLMIDRGDMIFHQASVRVVPDYVSFAKTLREITSIPHGEGLPRGRNFISPAWERISGARNRRKPAAERRWRHQRADLTRCHGGLIAPCNRAINPR